jgi:hypothetical protein
VKKRELA